MCSYLVQYTINLDVQMWSRSCEIPWSGMLPLGLSWKAALLPLTPIRFIVIKGSNGLNPTKPMIFRVVTVQPEDDMTWKHFIHHDDVIKWKHFPRYWPFVRGIHRSPVNSPHKGQWRGAFMFSLICTWINRWVNNREAGDLRSYRAHYDVIVMHN